jgi:glycosyltransferase involved in cell wall biosynthesis
MRITVVISSLSGGGAERVCVNLANAWVNQGRQVTILTMSSNSHPSAYPVDPRVQRCDVGWPRAMNSGVIDSELTAPVLRGLRRVGCPELVAQIKLIATIRAAILASSPDVVVAHIDMTNVLVLAAMQETGVPVIACEHTDLNLISLPHWQSTRQALYRGAAAVVASHPASADWLKRSGATAYSIPNPLVAPPSVKVAQNGDRDHVIALTRLSHEKRPALLVRAFASIAGDFPTWDLEIFGVGPLEQPLAGLINELAPGRIRLRGFVSDPYAPLRRAKLFVSTSHVEGFGNAIWEALACGVPVVAMECGASVRSLVRDGVDGLIVSRGGISALAAALASLMGDEPRRKAFAARAPEVLTRFSIESSLEAWDELLRRVTGVSN